jgi:putative ABC transport system permease protein
VSWIVWLSTYAAERRTKEIGIRKVLGASVNGLVYLYIKRFFETRINSIGNSITIAWYFMNQWLQDFAYRITINWWVFVIAAVIAVMIAVLTVSFQAIKAAFSNPMKALRSE